FFGGTGHFSYQNLKRQHAIIEKNVSGLATQGRKLEWSVTALQSDPDSIVKEGRRLLLLQKREGIIRVEGLREKQRLLSPGGLVMLKKDTVLRLEPFLRAFALTGGLVVFLLFRPRTRSTAKYGSR
ncbi:MAG: septum formation initiator family protein, partial [Spirochaetaceae bacterium]|nr:septum formation initiator family protein [Spirochaetaceae bacterium]